MVGEDAAQNRGEVGAVSDLIARARLLAMAHENQGEYPGTASVIRELVTELEELVTELERLVPREVDTEAELATCEPETVVRAADGYVYERWYDGAWAAAGSDGSRTPPLPAQVIFVR